MIEMVYTEQKEMRWSVENEIILWIMWKSWCWDLEEIEIWQRNLAKKVQSCACMQELHIIFNFSAANFHNHTCAVYVLQEMYLRGLGTSSSLVSSPEVPATASCPVLCVSTNKTFLSILKLA